MPKICPHCGKEHATQEELDAAQGGNDRSEARSDPEPLPHEILAGEAPEEISEEYAPKKSKKSKKF